MVSRRGPALDNLAAARACKSNVTLGSVGLGVLGLVEDFGTLAARRGDNLVLVDVRLERLEVFNRIGTALVRAGNNGLVAFFPQVAVEGRRGRERIGSATSVDAMPEFMLVGEQLGEGFESSRAGSFVAGVGSVGRGRV